VIKVAKNVLIMIHEVLIPACKLVAEESAKFEVLDRILSDASGLCGLLRTSALLNVGVIATHVTATQ
jgi:hypothetical protein